VIPRTLENDRKSKTSRRQAIENTANIYFSPDIGQLVAGRV
jgi:hypothetical protein